MEKRIGMKEGTKVQTATDGFLAPREAFTTTKEAWFGQSEAIHIEAIPEGHEISEFTNPVPKGTTLRLLRMKEMNGVDAIWYFIEAEIEIEGESKNVLMSEFEFKELLGIEYSPW